MLIISYLGLVVGLYSLCIMASRSHRSDLILVPAAIAIFLITIFYAIAQANKDRALSVESTKTMLHLGRESHSVIIGVPE